MMRGAWALVVLATACNVLGAAEMGWRSRAGQPAEDTPSQRSVKGFGGWLVVTPDVDWEAKWNTPKDNTPSFNTADDVRQGETLTILVFFANPRLDEQRRAKVTCDIRVTRPDRTLSTNERGVLCAEGGNYGDSSTVYLSNLVVGFVGEPKDPLGTWVVDVTLHDDNANIAVPLKATFELK
jgi:hypothetical protein